MTQNELANKVAENTKMTKVDAKKAVDAAFDIMSDALVAGEEIRIPGFGAFSVKETKEREGRNPATGEKMTIPAKKSVKFRNFKVIVDRLN